MANKEDLVEITKKYYDSREADEFYHSVWGGEDIHVGLYATPQSPIGESSRKTVERMAQHLQLSANDRVLDIGAGYGGSARYLAAHYRCPVQCLNLSETENERNREKNQSQGLDHLIEVTTGNFEELPYPDNAFDVVWCQDSILHSNRKRKVLEEVNRVLKLGGNFIFTDPMQADDCPEGVLDPILNRIHLEEMGSVALYRQLARELGWEEVRIEEMPEQLVTHYGRVHQELKANYDGAVERSGKEYIDKMMQGLQHWVNGGKKGYLNWGILQFRKPNE